MRDIKILEDETVMGLSVACRTANSVYRTKVPRPILAGLAGDPRPEVVNDALSAAVALAANHRFETGQRIVDEPVPFGIHNLRVQAPQEFRLYGGASLKRETRDRRWLGRRDVARFAHRPISQ
jgi:hypothetical protein